MSLARGVVRSVATMAAVAAPALAEPPTNNPPAIEVGVETSAEPAREQPDFWVYETSADGKVTSTTVQWEGGPESFDGAPAAFVEQFTVRDKTREHLRTYYRATTGGGVHVVGWLGDSEHDTVTEIGMLAEPAELTLPIPFQAGRKAPIKSKSTLFGGGMVVGAIETEGSVEVGGKQTALVPAGTFECTQVTTTTTARLTFVAAAGSHNTSKTRSVACYAPDIGLVKLATTTDTEIHIKGSKPSTVHAQGVMTLAKYRVTKPSWQMQAIGLIAPAKGGK